MMRSFQLVDMFLCKDFIRCNYDRVVDDFLAFISVAISLKLKPFVEKTAECIFVSPIMESVSPISSAMDWMSNFHPPSQCPGQR